MAGCVVLMYRKVQLFRASREARLCRTPTIFSVRIQHLADDDWQVISLSERIVTVREARELHDRDAVIPFDDGTACTREHAMPLLERHRFPACVFTVAALLVACNEWVTSRGEQVLEQRLSGSCKASV